jgi:hypothetical protein
MTHILRIDEWQSSDPNKRGLAGWTSDPDTWTMIDTNEMGETLYKVTTWWGSGYLTDNYLVWADDEYDALDKTAQYLDLTGDKDYEECQRTAMENNDENDETFINVGHGYLFSENLGVEEAPEEYVEHVLNGGRNNGECPNYTIDKKNNRVAETV